MQVLQDFENVIAFFERHSGVTTAAAPIVVALRQTVTAAEAAIPEIAVNIANTALASLGPAGTLSEPLVDSMIDATIAELLKRKSTAAAPKVAAA